MTGKIAFKRIASNLMSWTGIHSLAERFYNSNKAFVLMYHRILSAVDDQPYYIQPGMFVSTFSFEKQIKFLKNNFKVGFLDDIIGMIQNGKNIGGHCAITFDDGWMDNYTEAFPVLRKIGVPATIFLTTGFVGTNRMFWPEELCSYLAQDIFGKAKSGEAPPSFISFIEYISRYSGGIIEDSFYERAIELLKEFSHADREEVLRYLRGVSSTTPTPRQMLSWDEVREMLSSGLVRFGSHTVNHEMLDQISLEKVRDEISISRNEIERRLGGMTNTFAYPNGNFNKLVSQILSEYSFNAAVTTRKGFVDRRVSLMEIPRIPIHEDVSNTIPMFRSRILFNKF